MNDDFEKNDRGDLFSKPVRAGKRTYFFDVKSTRGNDYYLTITESKKRFSDDGRFTFEKHKIFLYKEDFEKFYDGLKDVTDFIIREQPQNSPPAQPSGNSDGNSGESGSFSDVEFEDLK